jgi:hypothetical protein
MIAYLYVKKIEYVKGALYRRVVHVAPPADTWRAWVPPLFFYSFPCATYGERGGRLWVSPLVEIRVLAPVC